MEPSAAESEDPPAFEPEARPKSVSLRLVMERSLTKPELAEYDALDADEAGERARGLKTLHAEWSNIGDISNFEPFEEAEVLYLQYNRIERIENLECLPKLQFLALQANRITAIENLLCLHALEFLDLSKNQIAELGEDQLPETVNMLNLKDNPCTQVERYRERVRARLPDLLRLDGKEMEESTGGASSSTGLFALVGTAEAEQLLSTEKGLGAYWRKGEMQSNVEASIKDKIQAYSIEALADVEGFDRQIEDATARSKARREGLAALRASARLSLGGAGGSRPVSRSGIREEPEELS